MEADHSDSEPSLGLPVSPVSNASLESGNSNVEPPLGFPPVSPVSQGSVEIELNGINQGWEVAGRRGFFECFV